MTSAGADQYVCNGAPGVNTLVGVTAEPAGARCAAGGVAVASGADTNGDGVLNSNEVTNVAYVCSGSNGKNSSGGCEAAPSGSVWLLAPLLLPWRRRRRLLP